MTTTIFNLTLGERLKLSLKRSGFTAIEMGDQLGVSRNAVSAWMNGRVEPRLGFLRLWAAYTNVELEWLCEGHPGTLQAYRLSRLADRFPDLRAETYDPALTGSDELPRLDSNQQHFD